jgi:hypothetical protein
MVLRLWATSRYPFRRPVRTATSRSRTESRVRVPVLTDSFGWSKSYRNDLHTGDRPGSPSQPQRGRSSAKSATHALGCRSAGDPVFRFSAPKHAKGGSIRSAKFFPAAAFGVRTRTCRCRCPAEASAWRTSPPPDSRFGRPTEPVRRRSSDAPTRRRFHQARKRSGGLVDPHAEARVTDVLRRAASGTSRTASVTLGVGSPVCRSRAAPPATSCRRPHRPSA